MKKNTLFLRELISHIPHFRSYKKLKLVKHLGDLCIVRSKLNCRTNELEEGIKLLYDSYTSAVITRNKKDIGSLILTYKEVKTINLDVKNLLNKNREITNKVEKINNIDYLYDHTIEQSILNSKNRAMNCIDEFTVISEKVSKLNSLETP